MTALSENTCNSRLFGIKITKSIIIALEVLLKVKYHDCHDACISRPTNNPCAHRHWCRYLEAVFRQDMTFFDQNKVGLDFME